MLGLKLNHVSKRGYRPQFAKYDILSYDVTKALILFLW